METRTSSNTTRDQEDAANGAYEAPGVEAVLTPEELEREILYGGDGTPIIML
jgi:hypothetical protein